MSDREKLNSTDTIPEGIRELLGIPSAHAHHLGVLSVGKHSATLRYGPCELRFQMTDTGEWEWDEIVVTGWVEWE